MSKRSAARGTAAASSIRLTLRTSNAVATSNASPSRCFLFCDGSRAARSARTAAATVSIPPIPKAPPNQRGGLQPHQASRAQQIMRGREGAPLRNEKPLPRHAIGRGEIHLLGAIGRDRQLGREEIDATLLQILDSFRVRDLEKSTRSAEPKIFSPTALARSASNPVMAPV